MKVENLIALTDKNKLINKFMFDELGMTWQVSFIRMVGGRKVDYHSAEHFYLSLIKSVEMDTDLIYQLSNWQTEVDLKEWCKGLIIKEKDKSTFVDNLKHSLKEIEEYKGDWMEEGEPKFNFENIKQPTDIINYWAIDETTTPRMKTGPTYGALAEFEASYFYIEHHLES